MHIDKNLLTVILETLNEYEKPFMRSKEIALEIQKHFPASLPYAKVDEEKCVMMMFHHVQILFDMGKIKLANPLQPAQAKPLGFILFSEEIGDNKHTMTLLYDDMQLIRLAHSA